MVEEKKIIEKLFQEINSNSGLGSYGLKEVIEMLKNNIAGTIIITDDTDLYRIELKCKRCQNIREEILERPKIIPKKTQLLAEPCPGCQSMDTELSEQDIVDYLALIAGQTGAKIEVIAGKAEHGVMLSSLGKIAAILRYNPNFN